MWYLFTNTGGEKSHSELGGMAKFRLTGSEEVEYLEQGFPTTGRHHHRLLKNTDTLHVAQPS